MTRPVARAEPLRSDAAPRKASIGTPTATEAATGRKWCLWFAARLGPWRKGSKMVNGVKVPTRRRTHELPPGPNGSRGNPFAHAKWVKDWREHARDTARADGLPSFGRVRISAVFKRRALGTADPDNDFARCKPLLDGLRDAGVLKRDTYESVEIGRIREDRAGSDGVGVVLILEELEHADRPAGEE